MSDHGTDPENVPIGKTRLLFETRQDFRLVGATANDPTEATATAFRRREQEALQTELLQPDQTRNSATKENP